MHDWYGVEPGLYHDMGSSWLALLSSRLNGVLPEEYEPLIVRRRPGGALIPRPPPIHHRRPGGHIMRRRAFLQQSATLGAAAVAAPTVVGAADKAGTKPVVVGSGDHRYEWVHHWGELPRGFRWQTTHGVAVDKAGHVYITHQGHGGQPAVDTVLVFDPAGKFVRSFGKQMHPGGHGIDVRDEGGTEYLYFCDVHHNQVVKTDLRGEVVWSKGKPDESGVYKGKMSFKPTNVAFRPGGGFYVADGYGSHFVHEYDAAAKYVKTWGGKGTGPGKFQTPHGIWFDDRPGRTPAVVVADRANARLHYFSPDGQPGEAVGGVLFPAHFDIRGDVLLVPDLHARVSLMDKDNKPLVYLGDDPAWTAEVKKFKARLTPEDVPPGKFIHPHDACFDAAGNILVVEWVQTGRVTFLKKLA